MSRKDQPFLPRADSPEARIRKSYYSFSKDYPKQEIELAQKKKPKGKAKRFFRVIVFTVVFLFLTCLSFFAADLMLRIAEKPVSEEQNVLIPTVETELTNAKALCFSPETLSDKQKVRSCIRQLKRKDCNSVVIDFKTVDGCLVFSSSELYAIRANSNLYDTKTVRASLSLFQKAQIQVIAGVHCFDDPKLVKYDPSLAVKYLGTDVLWLNAPEEEGGKPWLDPYQTKVRAYLKAVIREISALGVNAILLKDFTFPVGESTDTATYIGDVTTRPRNRLLKNLIASIKAELPESCALLLSVNADDMNGNSEKFDGSIFPNDCDGIVCNTSSRPSEIVLDREDGYAKVISYYNSVIGASNNASFLLEIPKSEASAAYLRALSRNGYSAYVIDR